MLTLANTIIASSVARKARHVLHELEVWWYSMREYEHECNCSLPLPSSGS